MIWLLMSSAWTVGVTLGSATTLLRLAAWSWLAPVIYYLVLEGGWGASLGKRLMGLRVTSATGDRWWLRVGLRTAVFHVPTVFLLRWAPRGTRTGRYTATAPAGGMCTALSLLLTILLFSTARRGNGWTGVHELLSRTRVVQRNALRAVASAAPKASPADLVPALSSLRRVGPYAVHTMVGETGGGRLFIGVDPILRRHVWIHEVPPGTPPVDATRRDVSRPGRLYWLAGRRSAAENWDAFEAPRRRAAAVSAADIRLARGASCALEPCDRARASDSRSDTHAQSHSRARLEDERTDSSCCSISPWPGLIAPDAASDAQSVELLAAVSTRALDPTTEPAAPLSGTTLLNRLASGAPPALADVKAELLRLASIPSRPSRVRRALPIVMAAMPVAVLLLIVSRDASHGREIPPGRASNMIPARETIS